MDDGLVVSGGVTELKIRPGDRSDGHDKGDRTDGHDKGRTAHKHVDDGNVIFKNPPEQGKDDSGKTRVVIASFL